MRQKMTNSPKIHHNSGLPMDPEQVSPLFRAATVAGKHAWVFLRLAQDPKTAYLGKMLSLVRARKEIWAIGTELAFHADDIRMSCACNEKGVKEGYDEILCVTASEGTPLDASHSTTDLCQMLANMCLACDSEMVKGNDSSVFERVCPECYPAETS